MLNRNSAIFSVFLVIFFLGGCASQTANGDKVAKKASQRVTQMEGLLIAEPAPVDPRAQFAIARYSQILTQPTLAKTERAELFYQRGILYDSAGLSSLAQFDFSQSINLKPDFAAAHNSVGVHFIQSQEFDRAFEAFDSALDIDPNYEFAFLNRGIALYYAGRPELSVTDLDYFLELAPDDPFRVLWAYNAHREIDATQAKLKLAQDRKNLDSANWASSLIDFNLGIKSESDVLNAVVSGVGSSQELTQRLCEVYFYLGQFYASKGQRGVALNYFKLSLSTNVYEYVEHRYARLEIMRIRENTDAQQ